MARAHRTLSWLAPFSAAVACAALSACQPPGVWVKRDGPEFVLSESAPTAQFRVKVCYDGPALNWAESYAYLSATMQTRKPANRLHMVMTSKSSTEDIETDEGTVLEPLSVDLLEYSADFATNTSRCTEAREIRVEATGEFSDEQEVEVALAFTMDTQYAPVRSFQAAVPEDFEVVFSEM